MPKSAAERQRERRARLKANDNLMENYRKADRHRKQRRKLNMSAEEVEALRERNTRNNCQWRKGKCEKQPKKQLNTPRSYKSAAAFGKARRKAERSLPNSPNKRTAIIQCLATGYNLTAPYPSTSKQQNTGLDSATKTATEQHYESDSISRVAPGKADVVTVRSADGSKLKQQKRHMTMTVSEAFELFKSNNPNYVIGKSSFAALRPPHVLLTSQMPHNVCGCKYHNNIILLLESLHRKCPSIPLYTKQNFLSLCVCDVFSENCMSSNCDDCSDGKLFNIHLVENLAEVGEALTWLQWGEDTSGYLVKQQQQGTVMDALNKLRLQLPRFLWHVFIKDKQSSSYDSDKIEAQHEDSTSCLLQMDFAENYTATFQDEIQSAHWRQRQITLFTIMMWARDAKYSSIVVSDVREHEKRTVCTYTCMALARMKETMPFVKNVNIWTDGPSSQFKNRYIFAVLEILEREYDVEITWNYSATSHGKGPNDALGGNVKRIAQRNVLGRKSVVCDAKSFAEVIQMSTQNIHVDIGTQKDVDEKCNSLGLDEIWSNTPVVPGTINVHSISSCGEGKVVCKFYKSAQESVIRLVRKPLTPTSQELENDRSSDSDDVPLAIISNRQHVAKGDAPCSNCGWVYESSDDPKIGEDWLQCCCCGQWLHETCAEDVGILDDNEVFTCEECL